MGGGEAQQRPCREGRGVLLLSLTPMAAMSPSGASPPGGLALQLAAAAALALGSGGMAVGAVLLLPGWQ